MSDYFESSGYANSIPSHEWKSLKALSSHSFHYSTHFVKNASLYGLIEKKRVHSAELLFQTMLTSGRMELHLCIYSYSKACQTTWFTLCLSKLRFFSLLQIKL